VTTEAKLTIAALGALAFGAGLLVWAASEELAIQAKRADTATNLAEVAAWQVSAVMDDVRRITAQAAEQRRGEIAP
jgi:hypothetical protein